MTDPSPPEAAVLRARILARIGGIVGLVGLPTIIGFFVEPYVNGSTQPFATLSDIFGLGLSAALLVLVLALRGVARIASGSGSTWTQIAGVVGGSAGTAGSAALVWGELGGPTGGSWTLLASSGLALQAVGYSAILFWCLLLGSQLKETGSPGGLRWGVIGATVLGLPLWLLWLDRNLVANPAPPDGARSSYMTPT